MPLSNMTPLDRLTHELAKLPGIGPKTALRLVLHILKQSSSYAQNLSQALQEAALKIHFCAQCFHVTDGELCNLCRDTRRETALLCVVEDTSDLLAIERSGSYRGQFHCLQGCLSPIDGIGPDQLRIQELLSRLDKGGVREVILATNPSVNGDATALYISKLLQKYPLRLTKLAAGIPVGSEIEYIDQLTLARALEARVDY